VLLYIHMISYVENLCNTLGEYSSCTVIANPLSRTIIYSSLFIRLEKMHAKERLVYIYRTVTHGH
jgi:hypothetical protein